MIDTIKALIHQNDLCVLATTGDGGPHTSLMAYSYSSDCSEIYLVTSRETQKYRNICRTPQVSLMVDTRNKDDRPNICALTISGSAIEMGHAEKVEGVRRQMLARHPQLSGLIDQPDLAWICVRVNAFQLLDGVNRSYHVRMTEAGKQL